MITALTVNYNTPDLLIGLLSSFRKFYDIPYLIVDGSESKYYERIKPFEKLGLEFYVIDKRKETGRYDEVLLIFKK